MEKPFVYFDIDKTMVDTRKMLENIQASLEPVGVGPEVFTETVNSYMTTLQSRTFFDPDKLIQRLAERSGVPSEKISAAFWQADNFANALFPEVLAVLLILSEKAELGTFSQGIRDWQEKKLTLSGLTKFFSMERRIIEDNKLSEVSVAKLEPNSWVIDDKEEVVQHLRKVRADVTTLWVHRLPGVTTSPGTIQSLHEVVTLLKL